MRSVSRNANRHTKMLVYWHDSFSAAPVDLQRAAAYDKHHDTCNHLRPKFIGVIILWAKNGNPICRILKYNIHRKNI